MKVAASIISWIGGVITTIVGFFTIQAGYDVTFTRHNMYGSYSTTEHHDFPDWIWIIWGVMIAIRIGVLIYRERQVYLGFKTACGILTLIFVSVLGGIFTLCIPEHILYGYNVNPYKNYGVTKKEISETPKPAIVPEIPKEEPEFIFVKPTDNHPVTIGEEVRVYRSFYVASAIALVQDTDKCEVIAIEEDSVTITVYKESEQFNAQTNINNILIKEKNPNYVSKEEQKQKDKFEEIKKYKELLDLNIITQEEFNEKKKELLDSK